MIFPCQVTPVQPRRNSSSSWAFAYFNQSTEEQSPQIQQLTTQWNDIVSRIRMLPHSSLFRLPPLTESHSRRPCQCYSVQL
ncbi:hypothetical protein BDR07DRAFT_1439438 [Suillus spraguei]|nr:hypothetical protein BDR07DRAFT_1439438 [Suillus spraguei]